jgi:phosphoenolpyruvate-protein kinase (PTS system EI component)
MLGVRRGDPRSTQRADPLHPAVLRAIREVVRAGHRTDRNVSICGEMASDPLGLVLLLGLGVTDFSMAPAAIPLAAQVVRDAHVRDLRRAASAALRGAGTAELMEMMKLQER